MNPATNPYHPTPNDIYLSWSADPVRRFLDVIQLLTPRVYVAKLLVLANVVVFVAMVASGVNYYLPSATDAAAWGASYVPATTDGQWWRLFTCMFVHFGIVHLALNMWVLWQLGPLAERLMGNVGFLIMYVVSGLAGSLASLYWSPHGINAGASGAIFGVAGAALSFTLLQKNSIPLAAFSGIKSSLVAFVGYNMVFGFAFNATNRGGVEIGMAAHTGGLVAGLICGALLSQPIELEARRRRWLHNVSLISVGVLAIGSTIRYMPIPELPAQQVAAQPQSQVAAPTAELLKAIDKFNGVDVPTVPAFHSLIAQVNAGQMDKRDFCTTVERDIIPKYQELRAQFAALKQLSPQMQGRVDRIIKYLEAREASFQLAADAVREDRESKRQEFTQMEGQALKLRAEAAQ